METSDEIVVEERTLRFACRPEQLRPDHSHAVRWLDWVADHALVAQFWPTRDEWLSCRNDGFTYCGVVTGDMLAARAAVWTRADDAWEVAAVWTAPEFRGRACAKSTVSFVTAHIFEHVGLATCHTRASNAAMQAAARAVGFELVS